jgi:hypothetical protein
MDREVSFSKLLGEVFALIGDGIRPIAIFVVVLGALDALGAIMGLSRIGQTAEIGFMFDAQRGIVGLLYQLFLIVVSLVAGYLLAAELLRTRNRLAEGGPRILPYIGLSILTGLGAVLGFFLLIIPGIILLVRWSAAPGFLIGAREGVIDAMSRSWDATHGHGWAIFFAGLVVFIGVIVVAATAGGMLVYSGSLTATAIVSAFTQEAGTAVSTAFTVTIYALVSNDHEELGEVFN